MSARVRLAATLPGDPDYNGVDAIIQELVDHPEKVRTFYVEADVSKIVDDTDTGTRIPYLRIRRAEYVGPQDQVGVELQRMFEKAVQARTGQAPLDFSDVPEEAETDGEG